MSSANRRPSSTKDPRHVNLTIGVVIKEARKAKKLSQEELARLLGYDSGQFVSDWERGLSAIPMKKLADICKLLKLDLEQLFELLLQFSVERLSESMRNEFREQRVAPKLSPKKR